MTADGVEPIGAERSFGSWSISNSAGAVRDVLRRILASGGNIEVEWTLQEVLETGDRVSPHQTIKGVADRLVYNPGRVELTEIWSNLGVSGAARHSAPWASIRDGIYSAD